LVVQEEGIIAEIKEAVSEEAAEEEGEMMDEKKEEMSEAPAPKKVVESVTKESFFSKELHDALVNEITELKAQLAEKEEVKEEIKEEVEMSSEEPSTEPITHNPENESQKVNFKYATSRSASTFDRVMAKIANS
jgi:predicted nuclease with TOPRIM domain